MDQRKFSLQIILKTKMVNIFLIAIIFINLQILNLCHVDG
jgi:hypothetical protein